MKLRYQPPLIWACIPVLLVGISGCDLESLSQRQLRQRQQFLGEGPASRQPLVWTGHRLPDAGSAISSLLAAHLYGGRAVVSEPLNAEALFILKRCDQEAPERNKRFAARSVGLVDVTQSSRLSAGIDPDQVVGMISHHALGNSPLPLAESRRVDLRPWGSTATILEQQAQQLGVILPRPLACAALGAILSDTHGLQAATTTVADRSSAQRLARRAGVRDLDRYSDEQLRSR